MIELEAESLLNLSNTFKEKNIFDMKFLHIKNLGIVRKYCSVRIVTKQLTLALPILFCLLVSSCDAIKELLYTPQVSETRTPKNTSVTDMFAPGNYCFPIEGKVISPFGNRGGHYHTGTDIKLHQGDTVRAAFCGRVIKAAPYYGYGNLVILEHANQVKTYYAHLSKCLVEEGDSLAVGDVVGLGGHTGRATTDHLHFEIRVNGAPRNSENYFSFNNRTIKSPASGYANLIKNEGEKATNDISSKYTTIHKGDTLYAIAKRNGTTVKQLQSLNNLGTSNLRVGMKLRLD